MAEAEAEAEPELAPEHQNTPAQTPVEEDDSGYPTEWRACMAMLCAQFPDVSRGEMIAVMSRHGNVGADAARALGGGGVAEAKAEPEPERKPVPQATRSTGTPQEEPDAALGVLAGTAQKMEVRLGAKSGGAAPVSAMPAITPVVITPHRQKVSARTALSALPARGALHLGSCSALSLCAKPAHCT